jgi:predicted transporter
LLDLLEPATLVARTTLAISGTSTLELLRLLLLDKEPGEVLSEQVLGMSLELRLVLGEVLLGLLLVGLGYWVKKKYRAMCWAMCWVKYWARV